MLALACFSALTALWGGAVLADPGSPGLPAPGPADPSVDTPDVSTGPDPSTDDQIDRIHQLLALSPAQGIPGAQFTARALGFVSCSTLAFTWDNGQVLGTAGVDRSGVSIGLNVPPDASATTHTVTVSCGEGSATAEYTVIASEEAKLAISPETGRPGTQVAVTATGFGACSSRSQPISLQWNGQPLPGSPAGTEVFEVPTDATSGAHTVTATCGSAHASAEFTVTTEQPTLALDKEQGPHGSSLTASGSGFACGGGRVRLLWDGESTLRSDLSDAFSVRLTVPADASTGAHTLVASCSENPDIAASRAFAVVADTAVSAGAAFLSVALRSGKPGDQVRVNGAGFTCDDKSETVELAWDDGQRFDSPSTDASGNFSSSITVPISADAGSHSVLASCSDGSAAQSADFTVVIDAVIPSTPPGAPPPPPPPEDGNDSWVIALIVAVLILAVVGAQRIWRSKPRPNKSGIHVYAVSSPGGPPLTTVRETPAPGEATHAVRLKTHSDLGTLTIREVSDD